MAKVGRRHFLSGTVAASCQRSCAFEEDISVIIREQPNSDVFDDGSELKWVFFIH